MKLVSLPATNEREIEFVAGGQTYAFRYTVEWAADLRKTHSLNVANVLAQLIEGIESESTQPGNKVRRIEMTIMKAWGDMFTMVIEVEGKAARVRTPWLSA